MCICVCVFVWMRMSMKACNDLYGGQKNLRGVSFLLPLLGLEVDLRPSRWTVNNLTESSH